MGGYYPPIFHIMNYKIIIGKIFFESTPTHKFSISYYRKLTNGDYNNIKMYLLSLYEDSYDFKEIIYRIYFHIDNIPKCKSCGKKLKITYNIKKLYLDFCSYNCSNNFYEKKKQYEQTCLEKYGVKSTWQQNISRNKAINTFSSKQSQEKRNNTLRKNNTFNISKLEEKTYQLLKEKYHDIIRQYKSKLYPFACDFYVPSLDLYIECNYHWTHGKHPYDKDNKEDQLILKKWKEKNTKFYDNAINTWTIRDIKKRIVAKENNINYLEIWNYEEIILFLKNNN